MQEIKNPPDTLPEPRGSQAVICLGPGPPDTLWLGRTCTSPCLLQSQAGPHI